MRRVIYTTMILFVTGIICLLTSCTTASIELKECKVTCGKSGVKSVKSQKGFDDSETTCLCKGGDDE